MEEQGQLKTVTALFDTTELTPDMRDPTKDENDFSFALAFIPLLSTMPSRYMGRYFAVGSENAYVLYGVTGNGMIKEIYKYRSSA